MLEHSSLSRSAAFAATVLLIALASPARAAEQNGLDAGTREALQRAIDDARSSRAFYEAVVARHGKLGPFVGVLEAESRQDEALTSVAKSNGIDSSPAAEPHSFASVPDNVKDACSAAVDAEKRSVALYDEVIAKVSDDAIRENLKEYRQASATRQLPAFERCVASGGVVPVVAERCGDCGMVGCGCSERAQASQTSSESADAQTTPKPYTCGCRRGQ